MPVTETDASSGFPLAVCPLGRYPARSMSAEPAAELAGVAPRQQCEECGLHPKAIVRVKGKRKRAKLCAPCIKARLNAAPLAAAPVGDENGDGHEPRAEHVPLCGASKRSGGTCKAEAGKGTDHPGIGRCKNHGGSTPTHQMQAAKIQAQMHAVTMGAPVDIEPIDALLWCVHIAAGEVSYCNAMVAALAPADAVGRQREVKTRPLKGEYGEESRHVLATEETVGEPALHIWINARHNALDRLAKFSKLALDAGVAERQVQLAEQWGEALGRIIGNILDGLRLTPDQLKRAPELVRSNLATLEGTAQEVA